MYGKLHVRYQLVEHRKGIIAAVRGLHGLSYPQRVQETKIKSCVHFKGCEKGCESWKGISCRS